MEIKNTNVVYFSATYTTRTILRQIANQLGGPFVEHDVTLESPKKEITHAQNDLLVVGVPVYSGRIAQNAISALSRFKGANSPAIIVCVYGNRDYDDALLELKELMENNGFVVISAGAFIAQHSIFPTVGAERPDSKDIEKINEFANKSADILKSFDAVDSLSEMAIKGNTPYKTPRGIPIHPRVDRRCNRCGTCVKLCPTQAIPLNSPRKTDNKSCISCGRCIVICPKNARHFGGLLYKIAGKQFIKSNLARKEPEMIFASKR